MHAGGNGKPPWLAALLLVCMMKNKYDVAVDRTGVWAKQIQSRDCARSDIRSRGCARSKIRSRGCARLAW